ncbi:MAG TPA: metallophosphoesterase, partial [Methylomicrobium sp.]|nr:metallophosphoesterase [Methylomicrobium sp.]
MKVLAVSDNVLPQLEKADFIRKQYGDTDLIISCGDLPAPYLDFISSMLNRPMFYVRGNHDMNYEFS